VAGATGLLEAVVLATAWALREGEPYWSLRQGWMALLPWRCAVGRWGERARDSGAKAVQRARRVVRAGARA
jgi:hypothetical protein